jgi:hypothetical protein
MSRSTSPWPSPAGGVGVSASGDGDQADADRIRHLIAARDQLEQALVTLDEYARSPAAATVDMAIHQINRELGL